MLDDLTISDVRQCLSAEHLSLASIILVHKIVCLLPVSCIIKTGFNVTCLGGHFFSNFFFSILGFFFFLS